MCQLDINIPEEVLYDTKMSRDEARNYIKRLVALDFYSRNGVSIGYCAQIADMPEEDFIKLLSENRISIFNYSNESEFIEELNNLF